MRVIITKAYAQTHMDTQTAQFVHLSIDLGIILGGLHNFSTSIGEEKKKRWLLKRYSTGNVVHVTCNVMKNMHVTVLFYECHTQIFATCMQHA